MSSTVTVYWRPGCGFCAMLRGDLDQRGVDYVPVNIWESEEGAALVRAANRGNELVPTVVVGGTTLSNPSAGEVIAAMGAASDEG